jgi:hypothetical protein
MMALAGISPTGALIQILPDGTRKTVEPDDRVRLVPACSSGAGRVFKQG